MKPYTLAEMQAEIAKWRGKSIKTVPASVRMLDQVLGWYGRQVNEANACMDEAFAQTRWGEEMSRKAEAARGTLVECRKAIDHQIGHMK